ncbi:MFS transporter permease [Methylobrevis pamukkalensis]|uniref:Yip1 domain protein n=1 Tax=Methylobrevis pamukkalensis TaxID=1439726 RepID=A0A1E3H3K5_9HYPH|nr:MFS transporter permease [Methylobrevis pamukkalensis]ODN70898.1 hypothetical protein A6302_01742 [Methylobrevis pamukkalensis]
MDFMTLLRSAEMLLYEMVSWLAFYPITLWRCLTRPLAMIVYAEKELTLPVEEQFSDALSPPIFLFLTVLLATLAQSAVPHHTVAYQGLLSDSRNLLIFRAVIFSLFPLLLGIQHVRLSGLPLTRRTLRPMFYAQSYVTVPFVLAVDLALLMIGTSSVPAILAGLGVFLLGIGWYFAVLMRSFMIHRGVTIGRAIAQTVLAMVLGSIGFTLAIMMTLVTGAAITEP